MLRSYLIIFFIIVLLIILMVLAPGCTPTLSTPAVVKPLSAGTAMVFNSMKSTNWVLSIFLLALVVCLMAGFNGMKTGWGGAAACFCGILLKGMLTQVWLYWSLGLMLVGGVGLYAASVLLKNRALTEIITGVQRIKGSLTAVTIQGSSKVLAKEQSKATQHLVGKIKTDLKVKGKV